MYRPLTPGRQRAAVRPPLYASILITPWTTFEDILEAPIIAGAAVLRPLLGANSSRCSS